MPSLAVPSRTLSFMEEPRLRQGVSSTQVIEMLGRRIDSLRNIRGVAGSGMHQNYAAQYLVWADDAERAMRDLFEATEVWQAFHSSRYEDIKRIATWAKDVARPNAVITSETEVQERRLVDIRDYLEERVRVFQLENGCMAVVPDTNIFIHCERFDKIDWPAEVRSERVRLVVPESIVDDLDSKSYNSNPLGKRVKGVLRELRKLAGDGPPTQPVSVRKNVELQYLMDPPRHQRLENADDELLTRVEALADIVGRDRVRVITGDLAMQLRARNRGLPCNQISEKYRVGTEGK